MREKSIKHCSFCNVEKPEDEFYMYNIAKMTTGREQRGYVVCKDCSDKSYGDKWYSIEGYDQHCEISNQGYVRELRDILILRICKMQAQVMYI